MFVSIKVKRVKVDKTHAKDAEQNPKRDLLENQRGKDKLRLKWEDATVMYDLKLLCYQQDSRFE